MATDASAVERKPSWQEQKAEATKTRICQAVVQLLDEVGYSETSINRVQDRADVSRGALTHHFPTKQDLVAETAMRVLAAALSPVRKRIEDGRTKRPKPTAALVRDSWTQVVNTPQGRAFLEILVACRTDRQLHSVLAERLTFWDAESAASVQQLYRGTDEAPDDAALLWSICRTFVRGLLIQEQFTDDPDYVARMVDRFSRIMEGHLLIRDDIDHR